MKKMRFESLEHLLEDHPAIEVAREAFKLADKTTAEIRQDCGIETDRLEVVILGEQEFTREEVK